MEKRLTSSNKRIVEFCGLMESEDLLKFIGRNQSVLETSSWGGKGIDQEKTRQLLNEYLEPYQFEITKDYTTPNNIGNNHLYYIQDKDVLDDIETLIGRIAINNLMGYAVAIYQEDMDGKRIGKSYLEITARGVKEAPNEKWIGWNQYIQDMVKVAKASDNHTWFLEPEEFLDKTYAQEDLDELSRDLQSIKEAGVHDMYSIVEMWDDWKEADEHGEPVATFHGAFLDLFAKEKSQSIDKNLISFNSCTFEINLDSKDNGEGCLKWHNYFLTDIHNKDHFYIIQIVQETGKEEPRFSLEKFEKEEGSKLYLGEWVELEDVIKNSSEIEMVQNKLIELSDKEIGIQNEEIKNIEDDFEELDEVDDDGFPMIAICRENKDMGGNLLLNEITSIYEKEKLEQLLNRSYENDKTFYTNKKTEQYVKSRGLQLSKGLTYALSNYYTRASFNKSQVEQDLAKEKGCIEETYGMDLEEDLDEIEK